MKGHAFIVVTLLAGWLPAIAGAKDPVVGELGVAELEVGQKAPAFTLHGSDAVTYTLTEHAGKRGVVLAWFPKAFTPG